MELPLAPGELEGLIKIDPSLWHKLLRTQDPQQNSPQGPLFELEKKISGERDEEAGGSAHHSKAPGALTHPKPPDSRSSGRRQYLQ